MLLDAEKSVLLIIDVQEKLWPACVNGARLIEDCVFLIACARRLGVPVLVSEQYPRGLGRSAPAILKALGDAGTVIAKLHFSCVPDPTFQEELSRCAGRDQIVIAGMETHVCVLQTALDLAARGHDVHVCGDAVTSRARHDIDLGLERMRAEGVAIVSRESVMFEWLRVAGTPEFRELSKLIR